LKASAGKNASGNQIVAQHCYNPCAQAVTRLLRPNGDSETSGMRINVREPLKTTYRMYRRRRTGVYYIENNSTDEQQSLRTTNRAEAKKLLDAKNQTHQSAALNLQLGTLRHWRRHSAKINRNVNLLAQSIPHQ
jgi:hypothetical protein